MGGQELYACGLPVLAQDAGARLAREYHREINCDTKEQALVSSSNQEHLIRVHFFRNSWLLLVQLQIS